MKVSELEYKFKRIEIAEQNYRNALIKLADHAPHTKAYDIQEACVEILHKELLNEIKRFKNENR